MKSRGPGGTSRIAARIVREEGVVAGRDPSEDERVTNPDDKEEIIEKVSTTKLNTCLGPMDFTAPVQMGTRHPVKNVYTPPVGGAQWVKGTTYDFEPVTVSNALSDERPVATKVQPIQYA